MAILRLNVAPEMFVIVRTSSNGWHVHLQEKSVFTHVTRRHVNLLGQKIVFK